MLTQITPSFARDLLSRHGLRPKRSLGQNFLIDPNTARRIVRLAGVEPTDTVVEIGPGIGSLTVALASAAKRVVAVEIDARVADALLEVVDGHDNVTVIVADALEADLPAGRVVANLPYNVATPIFARVLDEFPKINAGLLMVQRELGERWTASPGSKTYGAITVKVGYHANASLAGDVPRTVFYPKPAVDSVLVSFERRDAPPVEVDDAERFLGFVASVFTHRRKTMRNALAAAGSSSDGGPHASLRPEQLPIEAFAEIYSQ